MYEPYTSPDQSQTYESSLQNQSSIPRKQIGAISTVASPITNSEGIPKQNRASVDTSKGNKFSSVQKITENGAHQADYQPSKHTNGSGRSVASPRGLTIADDAQAVVDRARTNTKETHVTESVAPGETVECLNVWHQS